MYKAGFKPTFLILILQIDFEMIYPIFHQHNHFLTAFRLVFVFGFYFALS